MMLAQFLPPKTAQRGQMQQRTLQWQIQRAALQPDLILRHTKTQAQFWHTLHRQRPSAPAFQKFTKPRLQTLFYQSLAQNLAGRRPAGDPIPR